MEVFNGLVTNGGIVTAQSRGTVRVRIIKEQNMKYLADHKTIVVTFGVKDLSGTTPIMPEVSHDTAEWGTNINVTKEPGQIYEIRQKDNGIEMDNNGVISANNPGIIKVRTKISAVNNINNESNWSLYKTVTFTRQTNKITNNNQRVGPWGHGFNLIAVSEKSDITGTYTYAIIGGNATDGRVGANTGVVTAESSGDVSVKISRAQDDKYLADHKTIVVTFLKQRQIITTGDQSAGPWNRTGFFLSGVVSSDRPSTGIWSYALGSHNTALNGNVDANGVVKAEGDGDVSVDIFIEPDKKYEGDVRTITVEFDIKDLSGTTPIMPEVSHDTAEWGTNINVTKEPGQIYEIGQKDNGIEMDNNGVISANNPGIIKVKTKISAVDNINNESHWSPYKTVRFTKQTQKIVGVNDLTTSENIINFFPVPDKPSTGLVYAFDTYIESGITIAWATHKKLSLSSSKNGTIKFTVGIRADDKYKEVIKKFIVKFIGR